MWRRDKNDGPIRDGLLQPAMPREYHTLSDGQIACHQCGSKCFNWAAFEGHPCSITHVISWEGYRRVDTATHIQNVDMERTEMANVVICDRCGELTEGRVVGKAVYQANLEKGYMEFVLCPDCSRETHQFFTGLTKPHNITAAFDPDAEPENGLPSQKETSSAALDAHVNGKEDEAYDG